jgi:inosose dehydratase
MALSRSRRQFILDLGSLAAASVLPARAIACEIATELERSATTRCSASSIMPDTAGIRFGYAAITWGGDDLQAIKDVSDLGFRGIQLRSNILKEFGDKPKALAELLSRHALQFVALSGGGPGGENYQETEAIALQAKHSIFLRDAGGLYLQMTDSARPKNRKPTADDFKKLGRTLTEVGKRASDSGVTLAYHNHMGSLGQGPEEVDRIMDAADARYAKLLLDVAHCAQGGGDPAKAIQKYRERILFLHIKDVEDIARNSESNDSESYRFVELGRGKVDLPAVFAALKQIKFRGWAIVELDSVPDKARTPKESAEINKKYLESKLGMKI